MGLEHRDYMQAERPGAWRGRWAVMATTHKIVVLCCVVWVLWQLPPLRAVMRDHFTVSWDGVFRHGRVWTLFSSAFSHQDPWHLLWNMLFLHWFGLDLERLYGRRNFWTLYLYGALLCALAHALYSHVWGFDVPALGASGSVMAIVVVAAIFFPWRRILLFFMLPVPLWLLATIKLVGDLSGVLGSGGSGIAHAGHLGGAAAGALFWWLDLRLFASPGEPERPVRLRALLPRRRAAAAAPPPPRPSVDPELSARVDELLRKIKASGLASLSDEERAFLDGASRRFRRG
ncbi:MAG: rhomboid family intramembrane serine protease [Planctomycetota bacterium]